MGRPRARVPDPYDDLIEYWKDAVDIVKRGLDPNDLDIEHCPRSDGSEVFWDEDNKRIVFVSRDGKIANYYSVPEGREYYLRQCTG